MTSPAAHSDLSGLVAVEAGSSDAVKFCCHLLSEFGARVIRVGVHTPVAEDPVTAAYLGYLSRAKEQSRAWTLDDILALEPRIDLVVTDDSAPLDGRLLERGASVLAITPFGQVGPAAGRPGGDLIVSHAGGYPCYLRLVGGAPPDRAPIRGPDGQAQLFAGLVGAVAAVGAVLARGRGATPRRMDLSEHEAQVSLLYDQVGEYGSGGTGGSPKAAAAEAPRTLVGILPCSDGYVVFSPREDHQWQRFMELLGKPDWCDRPEFATRALRSANWPLLQPLIAPWTGRRTKAEVFRLTQEQRIACFPVSKLADLGTLDQLEHRGFWQLLEAGWEHPIKVPGLPVRPLQGEAPSPGRSRPPGAASGVNPSYPLAGLRVLDFSWVVGGPICTKYLALLGAEVIKVESATRPEGSRRTHWSRVLNTSKRSATINLQTSEGQALALELAATSDVVVENFSAGVMERLHLGFEAFQRAKGDIIQLSMSGLGRTGPGKDMSAYGSLLQAYSGWTSLVQPPGPALRPVGSVPAWADHVSALMGTLAILAALRRRELTGMGAFIDLSMVESVICLLLKPLIECAVTGREPPPRGNSSPVDAPHGCYPCAGDDEWVAIAAYDDLQWDALVDLMGRPGWCDGLASREERAAGQGAIDARLSEWTRGREAASLAAALEEAGVPAARSNTLHDLVHDPHLQARRFFREGADGGLTTGFPWIDSIIDRGVIAPAPELGEGNEHVFLGVLGLTPRRYRELLEGQVIV